MNIFSWLIYWITKPFGLLLYLCYLPLKDYGLAIILFTFVTRVLLFPLAIKQQRSMAENARIQPKVQAIQKKYAKDQKKMQEAMMALHQEEGYNPMSGCLPMLIQLPIVMILYNVIINPLTYIVGVTAEQLAKIAKYLPAVPAAMKGRPELYYANLLTNPQTVGKLVSEHGLSFLNGMQTINFHLFGIRSFDLSTVPTWSFNVYLLIPILCYVTQAVSSWMSMKMNASVSPQTSQSKGMNISMTLFMPLISLFFAFSFPSAMGIYWIATNVFIMLQVLLLNRFYNPKKLANEAEERSRKRREERLMAGLVSPEAQKLLQPDKPEKKSAGAKKTHSEEAPRPRRYSKTQLKKINRQRLAAARKRDEQREKGK